jgi:hypothetical protein
VSVHAFLNFKQFNICLPVDSPPDLWAQRLGIQLQQNDQQQQQQQLKQPAGQQEQTSAGGSGNSDAVTAATANSGASGGSSSSSSSHTSFIILADPEFVPLMDLAAGLDFAFPSANKIGGCGALPPAGHTCWSHLLVTPAGHTCWSHLLVTPAGHTCACL